MRAVADGEPAFDRDAALLERVDLVEQRLGVEHDPVADDAPRARVQNAGWNLVEHELPARRVHRVARVRPALVAHHQAGPLGEGIHHLALPLVAPLGADDHQAVRVG